MKRAAFILSAVILTSCVTVPKDSGFSDFVELTAPMLPAPAEWVGETITETQAQDRISALLSEPLNEASVAEITVLANRDLRAVLYGLKAASGDFQDRASLPNPFITAMFIKESGKTEEDCFGFGSDITAPLGGSIGIGIEILDILFFPRTLKAAKAEFSAAKLGSVRQFADITHSARISFYDAMAARQMLELAEQSHAATRAAADAAQAMYDAGNTAEVELSKEKLLEAQMHAQKITAQRRFDRAARRLGQAMGLSEAKMDSVKIEGRLRTPSQDELEALAVGTLMDRNLELKHREALMQAAGAEMGLKDVRSFLGDVELEGEREKIDGLTETRLGGSFELPIFNMGQGKRQAARARLEIMRQRYEASRRSLRTTADILYGELGAARQNVILQRKEILPLTHKVLQGTQLDYNAMQVGVFDLLDAKRNQLAAGQAYIAAVQDYWNMRASYEYLLAGGSPELLGSPGAGSMSMPAGTEGGH